MAAQRLMGKKRGMTQLFDDKGTLVACTVIELEPSVIVRLKTREKDGYEALQVGFDPIVVNDERTFQNRLNKPILVQYQKANVQPCRKLYEIQVDDTAQYQVGQKIGVSLFEGVDFVDITARSKGKGHQGVIKRHGFRGGPASHGSGFHRHGGSTGMRTSPGRCLPGQKKSGHMGDEQVTVQNLRVLAVDTTNNVLIVKGAVPGTRNGMVVISGAIKKPASATKDTKKKK